MSEQEIKRLTVNELITAFQTVTGGRHPADMSKQDRHDFATVAKHIHDVMISYSAEAGDFAKTEGGFRVEYLAWPEGQPTSLPLFSDPVKAAQPSRQANRHARRAQVRMGLQKGRPAGHA